MPYPGDALTRVPLKLTPRGFSRFDHVSAVSANDFPIQPEPPLRRSFPLTAQFVLALQSLSCSCSCSLSTYLPQRGESL
jgi:hypothetical protein